MILTRKKLKDILELRDMGKSIEQIMFSVGMNYEEADEDEEGFE